MRNKNNTTDIWREDMPFPEAAVDEPLYSVQTDGGEVNLTLEELINAAATGLNAQSGVSVPGQGNMLMEKLCALTGLPEDRMSAFLEKCVKTAMIHGRKCRLIEEGLDEKWASAMANMEFERDMGAQKSNPMDKLLKAYPDIKKIPSQVSALIEKGEDPLYAYQKYLLDEKDRTIKSMELNNKNINKFMGSVKGKNSRPDDELARILMES